MASLFLFFLKANAVRKDPNNWICGIFYYNKEDKRILPPKRIEWTGWTVNFANPKSVLFMIGVLLFFSFIVFRNK